MLNRIMGIKTSVGLFAVSLLAIVSIESVFPVLAHETEVTGEVGGTVHIEPNDNPQAGTPSAAWFALTRRGGELIPLEDCNCKLSIYAQPRHSADLPIEQPPLKPVSAEGYQAVPGADITFPSSGAYDLVLQGEPKPLTDADNFQPFELTFEVTVAVGQPAATPSPDPVTEEPGSIAPQPPATPASNHATWLFWGIPLSVLAIGLLLLFRARKKGKA